jgi:hypothetical protein
MTNDFFNFGFLFLNLFFILQKINHQYLILKNNKLNFLLVSKDFFLETLISKYIF